MLKIVMSLIGCLIAVGCAGTTLKINPFDTDEFIWVPKGSTIHIGTNAAVMVQRDGVYVSKRWLREMVSAEIERD